MCVCVCVCVCVLKHSIIYNNQHHQFNVSASQISYFPHLYVSLGYLRKYLFYCNLKYCLNEIFFLGKTNLYKNVKLSVTCFYQTVKE